MKNDGSLKKIAVLCAALICFCILAVTLQQIHGEQALLAAKMERCYAEGITVARACAHTIGSMRGEKTTAEIFETLALCDDLGENDVRFPTPHCYDGVYTTRGTPFIECEASGMKSTWKPGCYQQYALLLVPHATDAEIIDAAHACSAVPQPYSASCFYGIGLSLARAAEHDPTRAESLCNIIDSSTQKGRSTDCLITIAAQWHTEKYISEAYRTCDLVEGRDVASCVSVLERTALEHAL